MITISIDVTLIDKKRIKEVKRRNGETAKFVDLVLIETPNGEYGDYMVKQSQSKEERASGGAQLPILGNGKIYGGTNQKTKAPENDEPDDGDDTSVPF